jgi:Fungal N-terminal domain of STAND proteins/Ankyrin repeat
MDPLSLAASVAGLISISLQLTQLSYDYITSARTTSESIVALHRELVSLQHVLSSLNQNILSNPDIKDAFAAQASAVLGQPEDILKACESNLISLKNKLAKKNTDKPFARLKAVLSWPFSEENTQQQIRELHRYQDIFQRVISIDILSLVAKTHLTARQTDQNVQNLCSEVKDWRHREENSKILRWLSALDFSSKQSEALAKRSRDTCSWLLEDPTFGFWLQGSSPSRTLWCPGELGAGKTVITSIVVSMLIRLCAKESNVALGYIYCNYNAQLDQTPAAILGSLVQQLAISAPITLLPWIEEHYCRNMDTSHLQNVQLASEMLIQASNYFSRTFLVFDALDETENESTKHRKELLNAISSLTLSCPNISIFVTSRSHLDDINTAFKDADVIPIRARNDDVECFLKSRIEESQYLQEMFSYDPSFEKNLISTIANKSGGQFLLPELHMDRLCGLTCLAEVAEALADMSKSVKATYEQTLKRLGGRSKERRDIAMETLMWVCASTRPLRFPELRDALAIQVGARALDVRAFRSRRLIEEICLGLVKIEKQSEEVQLIHFTLEEYLRRQPEFFNDAHAKITAKLLTLLRFDIVKHGMLELDLDCDSLKSGSTHVLEAKLRLFDYAFRHWAYHACRCQKTASSYTLDYFATRPRLVHIYTSNQTLDTSELSRPEPSHQNWVNLVYATLCGFETIGKQLIKAHGIATMFVANLKIPTILSWVMYAFTVGKWYVRYKYPWMRIPKSICDSIELLLVDDAFFQNASERDHQNFSLLLLKSPETVIRHVLDKGFDLDRRQHFSFLTDVDHDPNADRRNLYAPSRVLKSQLSQRYTVLAAHESTDRQADLSSDRLSLLWISMLSKYFQEWTITSSQDHEGKIESLLRLGANPNQPIGHNSFITETRSTFPIVSNHGYTPMHFAVSDLDHKLVSILLSAGADVNAIDAEGSTPLVALRRDLSQHHHPPASAEICNVINTLMQHGATIKQLTDVECPSYIRVGQKCIWQTVVDILTLNKEADTANTEKWNTIDIVNPFIEWYEASIVTDKEGNKMICNQFHCPRRNRCAAREK